MKNLLLYIPFKKVLERSRKTIISYAIFIHSGKFHKLLLNSRTYSVSICMEKKILVSSDLFSKVPVPSLGSR